MERRKKMEKNMKKNEFFFQEHDIFIDFQKKLNKYTTKK